MVDILLSDVVLRVDRLAKLCLFVLLADIVKFMHIILVCVLNFIIFRLHLYELNGIFSLVK